MNKGQNNIILMIGLIIVLSVAALLLADKFSLNKDENIEVSFPEAIQEEDFDQMAKEFMMQLESTREEVPTKEPSTENPLFPLVMKCNGGKEFSLNFITVSNSPGPGAIPVPVESTSALVELDSGEKLTLALDGDINLNSYTFSNLRYKDQEKIGILKIENNVANISLSTGEKYNNCVNEELEESFAIE